MTPTNKLRFVERKVPGRMIESGAGHYTSEMLVVHVLQQWWEPHYPGSAMQGEWRDVPLEEEE